MNDASRQTSSMAAEITTGSGHMASAAEQMAVMAGDLSLQSSEMAETIRHLSDDANELVTIASALEAGAEEGVARNSRLRTLATENRDRLDESARALGELATDARSTVEATEALAAASEEIRAFVVLVQKIARQSKLLALNAAMEAARAGEEGQGFAIVAGEVRRLSAAAADGAERTEAVVAQLLKRVGETRASSARAVDTMQSVIAATQQGHDSFAQVEQAVSDAETWTASIANASHRTSERVQHMTGRIEQMAKGTEGFVAAMQEVAASSQQQSASTQQIAAAAERLAVAAEKLNGIVSTFRLERQEPATAESMDEEKAVVSDQSSVVSPKWTPLVPSTEH
jgi:methyl-accepting chemotaxis protein